MKKKEEKLYDENGHWIEERGRIKGAIRRVFRLHPIMKELLQEARVELPPKILKNGSVGKKNQIRYRCARCGELFPQKHIQVDHVEPVIPLHKSESEMSFEEWIVTVARGIFCSKENLQVLCSTPQKLLPKGKVSCHRLKTNEENFIREEFKKMYKQNPSIYQDLDKENIKKQVDFFREMYVKYLVYKEEERLAKEKKKLERISKKKSKK